MWIPAGVVMVVVAITGALRFETAVQLGTALSRLNPLITRRANWRSHVRIVVGIWLTGVGVIGALLVVLTAAQ